MITVKSLIEKRTTIRHNWAYTSDEYNRLSDMIEDLKQLDTTDDKKYKYKICSNCWESKLRYWEICDICNAKRYASRPNTECEPWK